jgi:hypothetical protein
MARLVIGCGLFCVAAGIIVGLIVALVLGKDRGDVVFTYNEYNISCTNEGRFGAAADFLDTFLVEEGVTIEEYMELLTVTTPRLFLGLTVGVGAVNAAMLLVLLFYVLCMEKKSPEVSPLEP